METLWGLALAAWSAAFSFVMVLLVESQRKPRLKFKIAAPSGIPHRDHHGRPECRFLSVHVWNEPIPKWTFRSFNRNPALACRGWISFHHLDGQDLFGKKMPVRWANNPEPLILDPKTGAVAGFDWDKMRLGHIWDIWPEQLHEQEEPATLNVAVRFRDGDDCYGWNNQGYVTKWRNPEWRLPPGRYLVKIALKTGGQTFTERVQLVNEGPLESFRLEPSQRSL